MIVFHVLAGGVELDCDGQVSGRHNSGRGKSSRAALCLKQEACIQSQDEYDESVLQRPIHVIPQHKYR